MCTASYNRLQSASATAMNDCERPPVHPGAAKLRWKRVCTNGYINSIGCCSLRCRTGDLVSADSITGHMWLHAVQLCIECTGANNTCVAYQTTGHPRTCVHLSTTSGLHLNFTGFQIRIRQYCSQEHNAKSFRHGHVLKLLLCLQESHALLPPCAHVWQPPTC